MKSKQKKLPTATAHAWDASLVSGNRTPMFIPPSSRSGTSVQVGQNIACKVFFNPSISKKTFVGMRGGEVVGMVAGRTPTCWQSGLAGISWLRSV